MFSTQTEVKAHVLLSTPVEREEFERRLDLLSYADAISFGDGNVIGSYTISPGSLPLDFVQYVVREMLKPGEWADIDLYEVELEPVRDRRLTALGAVCGCEDEAA